MAGVVGRVAALRQADVVDDDEGRAGVGVAIGRQVVGGGGADRVGQPVGAVVMLVVGVGQFVVDEPFGR